MMEEYDREQYSYALFNQIITDLNLMLNLLDSDQVEETQNVEKNVGANVKLVYKDRHSFDQQELIRFCLEYQLLHEEIVTKISILKENINESQKNKKVAATKIFTYTRMNNLKY